MANLSKTARASSRTAPVKGAYQPAPDVTRIVPLDAGRHAYVRDLTGHTTHFATDSDAFVAALVPLDTEGRITRELEELTATYTAAGWDRVAARLSEAKAAQADADAGE